MLNIQYNELNERDTQRKKSIKIYKNIQKILVILTIDIIRNIWYNIIENKEKGGGKNENNSNWRYTRMLS